MKRGAEEGRLHLTKVGEKRCIVINDDGATQTFLTRYTAGCRFWVNDVP